MSPCCCLLTRVQPSSGRRRSLFGSRLASMKKAPVKTVLRSRSIGGSMKQTGKSPNRSPRIPSATDRFRTEYMMQEAEEDAAGEAAAEAEAAVEQAQIKAEDAQSHAAPAPSESSVLPNGHRLITLERGDRGFGFSVKATDHAGPLYVGKIADTGSARAHGGLQTGNRIYEINGSSTELVSKRMSLFACVLPFLLSDAPCRRCNRASAGSRRRAAHGNWRRLNYRFAARSSLLISRPVNLTESVAQPSSRCAPVRCMRRR